MKGTNDALVPLMAMSLALCLGLASCGRPQETGGNAPATPATTPAVANTNQGRAQAQQDFEQRRRNADQQARPDVEMQRREAEQQAQSTLDQDAITAIQETQNALAAIAQNNKDAALQAIERATGKINVLVARNPANAFIPVNAEAEVLDVAPTDIQEIRQREDAAVRAIADKDYPAARLILNTLTSEIRVRTYNLPLASYPAALTEAARLLDQNMNDQAASVLLSALNTLVIIERAMPIPVIVAQAAINNAEALRDKDKEAARRLLTVARNQIERARELGYVTKSDPDYDALNKAISDMDKQLQGTENTSSAFTALKDRVAAFFKRLSNVVRR